ncbi:hypothetical protein ElyMa_002728600 [Elysia marginata]|uniref:Uncharacterized protein n=1 Tax=Elysia marginata TaxID=1093978 RepID=A0AAV4HEU8_9GAST|nr:hypothetical protein ElyMa_002728600 [Elysia marginata]
MVMPQSCPRLFCARSPQALLPSKKTLDLLHSAVKSFIVSGLPPPSAAFECPGCDYNIQRFRSWSFPLEITVVDQHEIITVIVVVIDSLAVTAVKHDLLGMELSALSSCSSLPLQASTSSSADENCALSGATMGITSFTSTDTRDNLTSSLSPIFDGVGGEEGSEIPSFCDKNSMSPYSSITESVLPSAADKCKLGHGYDNELICIKDKQRGVGRGGSSHIHQVGQDDSDRQDKTDKSEVFIDRENKFRKRTLKATRDQTITVDPFVAHNRHICHAITGESNHNKSSAKRTFPAMSLEAGRNRRGQRHAALSADQVWPWNARHGKRRCMYIHTREDPTYRSNECISSDPASLSRAIFSKNRIQYQANNNTNHFSTRSVHGSTLHSSRSKEVYAHSKSQPNLLRPSSSSLPSDSTRSNRVQNAKLSSLLHDKTANRAVFTGKTLSHPALFRHEDETTTPLNSKNIRRKNSAPVARPTSLPLPTLSWQRCLPSGSFDNVSVKDFENFFLESTSVEVMHARDIDKDTANVQDYQFPDIHRQRSESPIHEDHPNPSHYNRSIASVASIPEQRWDSALDECEEATPLLEPASLLGKNGNPHHESPAVCKTQFNTPTTTIQLCVQSPTDDEDSDENQDQGIYPDFYSTQIVVNSPAVEDDFIDETISCDVASHRKRKFRRKRSMPYIFSSFIPKSNRQGKTKKLCKQRKHEGVNVNQPTIPNAFNVVVTAEKRHLQHLHHQYQQQQQHLPSQDSSPFQSCSSIPSFDPQNHFSNFRHPTHVPSNELATSTTPIWQQREMSPPYNCSYHNHNTWTAPSRSHSPSPGVTRLSFSHLNGHGGIRENLLSNPVSSGSRCRGLQTARAPKQYSSTGSVSASNGCLASSRPILHPIVKDLRREPGSFRTTKHIPRTLATDKKRRRGEVSLVCLCMI